jgi:hypothetical protein
MIVPAHPEKIESCIASASTRPLSLVLRATGLGEFNEQFIELVHILRAVIRVEAADDEGEGVEKYRIP